jgi:hypothetical protein
MCQQGSLWDLLQRCAHRFAYEYYIHLEESLTGSHMPRSEDRIAYTQDNQSHLMPLGIEFDSADK